MKHLGPNSWQETRYWSAAIGALVFAWTMTNATAAVAEPKGGPDHKEHAGPRGDRGHDKADHGPEKGERPGMMRGHEHESVDAGVPHARGGHRVSWAQHKARLAELKSKMDAGKLTDSEQSEVERLQRQQARHAALDAADKAKAQNRIARAREAKRQALQANPKVGKDPATTAEFRKHAERMAKLDRAKELAASDNDTEMLQKIDALIAKEQQRHAAWLAKNPPSAPGAAQ